MADRTKSKVAPIYGRTLGQEERAQFFKDLIADNKDWIGLTRLGDSRKFLDYGAASGILSFVCGKVL